MCTRSGLLIGWDDNTHRALVTRANCDSWNCVECSRRMAETWRQRALLGVRFFAERGEKLDFVTITSHEKLKNFAQTETIWRDAWSKLYAALKRCNPDLAYFIVPEKHKDGRMHIHALWTAGVTQRWLKDNARKRGLGYKAETSRITNPASAARYVSKYVGKGLGKDVPKRFRRVRVSQNWPDIPEPLSETSALRWEYVDTNGALAVVYAECKAKRFNLIDLKTGEYFDDIDLGTIVDPSYA